MGPCAEKPPAPLLSSLCRSIAYVYSIRRVYRWHPLTSAAVCAPHWSSPVHCSGARRRVHWRPNCLLVLDGADWWDPKSAQRFLALLKVWVTAAWGSTGPQHHQVLGVVYPFCVSFLFL